MISVVRHPFYPGVSSNPLGLPKSQENSLTGICIGNFDGVHAGHQQILAHARSHIGAQGRLIVVSFYPNPAAVLRKTHDSQPLQTFRLQLASMEAAGVNEFHLIHFTDKLSRVSAEEFLARYILPLKPAVLVLGSDARIGFGGSGDAAFISKYGAAHNIAVHVAPFLQKGGSKVSSRRIRGLIQAGEVDSAATLLTHLYTVTGRTQRGEQRGRIIGFPTINLHSFRQVIPAHGVYATQIRVAGKIYSSVTNVGVRPTLAGQGVRIETHLIDTAIDLQYGARVDVLFASRLRAERRFASVEELKVAIAQDVGNARQFHRDFIGIGQR